MKHIVTAIEKKKNILFLLFSLSIISLVFFLFQPKAVHIQPLESVAAQREQFKKAIDVYGSKAAYEAFVNAYRSEDENTQHLMAHLFGELLYKKEGVKGIAICDSSFSFGCYHSVFGQAFQHDKETSIQSLNAICLQNGGVGCQHGIGHGLMEFYGDQRIVDALEGCTKIDSVTLFGCSAGVFMEYNVPIVFTTQNAYTKPRLLDPSLPYGLCPSLAAEFKPSCFHELPQWWNATTQGDFARIISWCEAVQDTHERSACLQGIGSVVPPSVGFDANKTTQICLQIVDDTNKNICLIAAAQTFEALPQHKENAPIIRQSIDTKLQIAN